MYLSCFVTGLYVIYQISQTLHIILIYFDYLV